VVIHANVCIAGDVTIGSDSTLQHGAVVLDRCVIGCRVIVGPNSVIGADGFGYYTDQGVHHKIPHIGNVIIEDDVEIGACSCVDRAKFGSTIIGAGTKIDNLVQVAHNVQVGKGCFLCAQVGIAGSAKLGDGVAAGGHAGVRDNVTIGNQVRCSAFAAVASDVPDGAVIAGIPAHDAKQTFRELRALQRLPELLKKVRAIETRLESLVQRPRRSRGRASSTGRTAQCDSCPPNPAAGSRFCGRIWIRPCESPPISATSPGETGGLPWPKGKWR